MENSLKLRPLEREDLHFVHKLDNNESVMHYWFEEPHEAFVDLVDLYDKHIHDQSEHSFIAESDHAGVRVRAPIRTALAVTDGCLPGRQS